ncbi:hybrid sensor histidine kinase/response regulator [Kovacikia minuta CCNUW1]|uniref:sensor histidine kinase n=1 Tax=Kovacikia minuta TaxID=2931930 RepID=UPI001CCF495A|nr:hybrid sensor histidine kinase/response regulator [Kovacikia minuta]UBF26765.1 hybrid sensor histidine kinase/response regulator [Kovacikia minuta CCNUW1]
MNDGTIAVLLVEDNPADVALLMELLQDSDAERWQVTHAKRLSLALENLHSTQFDVILLDLSLPDSQGLDTVAQIQTVVPYIPIVVLTGLQDQTIACHAVAQGAQDYLVKGQLSPELLLKTVSYAIERAQILKKLQESEQRFRGVFDQTFQFMSLVRPDGMVLDVNQVTKDRMDFPNELVNTPIWEAPCWQSIAQSQSWLKEAVLRAAQGETMRSELQAYTHNGSLWWFDVSIKPLRDENNRIALLIAEGRDISNLKRAEAEIRQSLAKERELNEMKNRFISMVSHEFRNPLTTIRFATDLLQNPAFPEEKKLRYFENVKNATDQMLELLEEILLLGRTEAGRVEAEYTLLDLEQFCREIIEALQLTQENQSQILFCVQGNATYARVDPSLLKHILDNLLSNAIKYSPNRKPIRLTLAYHNCQAKFSIRDQGIGIPEKDQAKLFEAFHRAGNVRTIQGTGLGLAIVKRCVDLLQGQIQVETEEGIGTTFTVTLPLNLLSTE